MAQVPHKVFELLQHARRAAREAGRMLAQRIGHHRRVETKSSDRDLVTEVDREIEDLLRRRLLAATPRFDWLGEESAYTDGQHGISNYGTGNSQNATPAGPRWIVDPLDGTTNFVNGVPFCCVSIALYDGAVGRLGVIYDPFRDELFEAAQGVGAQLNGHRISVQPQGVLRHSLFVTGFPEVGDGPAANLDFLARVVPTVGKVRAFGSAALELAYVAAGRVSGFWELKLSPWDTAAGVLLVREAGGRVTTLQGDPYSLDHPTIVATNGRLHNEFLAVIRSLRQDN